MNRYNHPRRRWPARLAAGALCAAMLPPPVVFAQNQNARFKGGEAVTLNFVNADIEGVSRAMGAILKQQFIVDPRVKGTITLYSEEPLSPREAYLNFLAALRGLGFTVVEVGGLFKVVPEADAKLQSGTVAIGQTNRRGDQILTQIFRLNHENANNLVPVLRPLISPNNTINANPSNNTLVITDYADNLQRIARIIAAMDSPAGGDVEVILLKHAVASDIAPMVQRLTDGSSGAIVAGGPPGAMGTGSNSIIADPRNNSLLVKGGSAARLASIRALVDKLDQPMQGAGAAGNVWVVHLKNADAVKLAQVLRAAIAAGQSSGSGAGGLGGGPSSSMPSAPSPMTSPGGASPQATAPVSAGAGPSTGGFIQADPSTNSLVITAAEPLYRQVRQMIDQLDSRRAQVYIESMIVEVSGDNAADLGFQWQGLLGSNGDKYGVAAGTNYNAGNSSANNIVSLSTALAGGTLTAPGQGLNIALLKNYGGTYQLSAIARLLQSQSNTNIVSTPNLITLDNEEAKIIVGSNVPFVTGQYTNTGTSTSSPFQTIERKDVGITLRIKPQIGEGGTVRMTIFQESSSVSEKVAPGTSNAGPSTDKRSIESTVVVDDGSILVLGGLIEDKYTDNRSKVPLLGDIPVIGALFRSESRTKTRTNLMVFLRPVIMRDADVTNKISMDRYELIRAMQNAAQPPNNPLIPLNESPVLAPERKVEQGEPLAVPPSAPGAAKQPRPVAVPPAAPAASAAGAASAPTN